MRWNARLAAKQEDGATLRDHLERSAESGSAIARAHLVEPEYPDELTYLLNWAYALVGRSGAGMAGLAPLSHAEVQAWALLTDARPEPWEIGALMELDAALRWRPDDEAEKPPPEAPREQRVERAWPERNRHQRDE